MTAHLLGGHRKYSASMKLVVVNDQMPVSAVMRPDFTASTSAW